ncbi:glycosyltransferase, partial [Clostridioides difficile]
VESIIACLILNEDYITIDRILEELKTSRSVVKGYKEDIDSYLHLHQDTFIINKNFIHDILEIFKKNTDVGMIGVAGVKDMPVNG